MSDIIIRRSGPGYMVAEPYIRERDGETVIATKRRRFYGTATAAISAASERLQAMDTPEPPEVPQRARAQGRQPNPDRLRPQARHILHRLILMRGLTQRMAMEMSPPCYRLGARIHEIRQEFGYDAVETVYKTSGGTRYALYKWRGPDSLQLTMSEEAA